ncbi:MAG: ribosomal protein S5-alanine N-acetyltransferase [Gemmatimonadota bacterium]|nr:ribosomal protein S5-alanine N-acetyltransferase [Gemmatimonadota bacterium]
MPLLPTLRTERLVARPPADADAPAIARYYTENRAFLAPWEPLRSEAFFTEPFWRAQIPHDRREAEAGRALRLYLFPREAPEEVVGTIGFTQVVRGAFHACHVGYGLAERAEGRGLMREALGAAIGHLFDEWHLHRIMANHLPHNRRSGNLLRALGFVVEGYARDYLRINGRWEDHVLTSLTNPHWKETR